MPISQRYMVNDVNEAVKLAQEFQRSGKYNWFRGQGRDWPLCSSLNRLEDDKRETAKEKLYRFLAWISATPGLEDLVADVNKVFAVAQHYGIPTNYIDFTTDPQIAGFFASQRVTRESDDSFGCILCLDTGDLLDFWNDVFAGRSTYPPPELVTIEVEDLWRLQAQHGVFLFCPYRQFEHIYDIDRIYFQNIGSAELMNSDMVYPIRKSQLEILLDQFFTNEDLIGAEEFMRALREIAGKRYHEFSQDQRFESDLVVNGTLPPEHTSWLHANQWLELPKELFFDALTDSRYMLTIDQLADPLTTSESISSQVLAALTNARDKMVKWSVRRSDGNEEEAWGSCVNTLYDGLRRLPYTDELVAESLGNCVALLIDFSLHTQSERLSTLQQDSCFGSLIKIEFGADDGSYARAFVPRSALLEAVRADIEEHLSPEYAYRLIGNLPGLLQAIYSPRHLFDFERLTKVFARYAAPTQVIMGGNRAIFYSPARLTTLGRL